MSEQLADHTDVQKAEHAAATEHQCGAPVTDVAAIEKIEFLLSRDDFIGQLGQQSERLVDFLNVLLYQNFGAGLGLPVQHALAHTAHVAVDAFIERIQQTGPIFLFTELAKPIQPVADLRMVIELRGLLLSPLRFTGQGVMVVGRRQPVLIGFRRIHMILKLTQLRLTGQLPLLDYPLAMHRYAGHSIEAHLVS